MEVRAVARHQRVSPRKVRLVLDVIKGMPAGQALTTLQFMPQPSARTTFGIVGVKCWIYKGDIAPDQSPFAIAGTEEAE